jgi:hypothetical protein
MIFLIIPNQTKQRQVEACLQEEALVTTAPPISKPENAFSISVAPETQQVNLCPVLVSTATHPHKSYITRPRHKGFPAGDPNSMWRFIPTAIL